MIESGFRTGAVSRASAVGLWQFIARTGRARGLEITRRYDERRDPERATDAAIVHLRRLYQRFEDWPTSMAAYNAGSSRVRRWLKESRRMELDRFVERIPFNETRNYVRRVTTHFARYSYLDDPESGWPGLPAFVNP